MGNQSREKGFDETSAIVVSIVAIFALMFLLPRIQWIFFEYWRFLRLGEYTILSHIPLDFFSNHKTGIASIKDQLVNNHELSHIREAFKGLDDDTLALKNQAFWSYIHNVDQKFTKWIIYPLSGILFYFFYKAMGLNKKESTQHNYESFLNGFDKIKPYYADILGEKRLDTLSFKEAKEKGVIPMSPYDFATRIPAYGTKSKRPIYDPNRGDSEEERFDVKLARRSFDAQLGKLYKGYNSLTEKQKEFYNILKKYLEKSGKDIEVYMKMHAYSICGLHRAYEVAKSEGIVAPNWFRKDFKYQDPYLWRTISDTGTLPMVLGAGIRAHYELEKSVGSKILEKETTEAIRGLAETIGVNLDNLII